MGWSFENILTFVSLSVLVLFAGITVIQRDVYKRQRLGWTRTRLSSRANAPAFPPATARASSAPPVSYTNLLSGEMSVKEINYILKRVLQMIPVLLLVMVLIFALIRFIPGDPAAVSYTHLDVYKRQIIYVSFAILIATKLLYAVSMIQRCALPAGRNAAT